MTLTSILIDGSKLTFPDYNLFPIAASFVKYNRHLEDYNRAKLNVKFTYSTGFRNAK